MGHGVARSPLGWLPVRRVRVRGGSMSPVLADGDVVLAWRFGRPRPGDVVLVTWAARPGQLSVKRAGEPLAGGWLVFGDNAAGSTDSRTLGPATIHAVIPVRLWPHPTRLRPRHKRPNAK